MCARMCVFPQWLSTCTHVYVGAHTYDCLCVWRPEISSWLLILSSIFHHFIFQKIFFLAVFFSDSLFPHSFLFTLIDTQTGNRQTIYSAYERKCDVYLSASVLFYLLKRSLKKVPNFIHFPENDTISFFRAE